MTQIDAKLTVGKLQQSLLPYLATTLPLLMTNSSSSIIFTRTRARPLKAKDKATGKEPCSAHFLVGRITLGWEKNEQQMWKVKPREEHSSAFAQAG